MAASLARAAPFVSHARQLALVLVLLLGGTTPNFLTSAQHAENTLTIPDVVDDIHNVLVFQTSIDLRVPCVTPLVRPPRDHEPPARIIIATPTTSGTYPVILFKHGFMLANCHYTQLFKSLASAGYIIVAPQAVTLEGDCTAEIEEADDVANSWMPKSLAVVLKAAVSNANVVPNLSKLVMAGHSRGGKVAFAMALTEIPRFSALVTLDPVDCKMSCDSSGIIDPPIVAEGCNHTRKQMSFPVLILGTGYGGEKGILGAPACAPTCCSHMAYFNCSSAPIMYHLVASDYGHLDFLDDFVPIWISGMCKCGASKEPVRDFSSKLIVAFLKYALEDNDESMVDNVIENASISLTERLVYRKDDGLNVKGEHISQTIQHQEL